MKSARVSIFRNDNKQPGSKQPDGSGLIELPAQFVAELAQLLQTGQFSGTNQQGEPFISARVSVWRADGTTKLILSGQIESPAERAAYLATQQQQPQSAWGGPAAAPAQQGWGQAPQGVAPAPTQPWVQPMPGQPPAPQQWGPPAAAPQPDPSQPAF